jgi:hypothetical protein
MAERIKFRCPSSLHGAEMLGASGGGVREYGGEALLAQLDGGAHDGMSELRDTPAAGAGDLGHETAQVHAVSAIA